MKKLTNWLSESTITFSNNNKILLDAFFKQLDSYYFNMGNAYTGSTLHIVYSKYSLVHIKFNSNGSEFDVAKPNNAEEKKREYTIQKIVEDFNIPREIKRLEICKENLNKLLDFILSTRKMLLENKVYSDRLMDTVETKEHEDNINYGEIKNSIETEKIVLQKIRKGQTFFRDSLLNSYKYCKICGLRYEQLLIASHIKPWKDSNNYERLDPNNGLLLCPNHDKLFDKGYISFDANGKILMNTKSINIKILNSMGINEDKTIEMNDETKKYMEYHRNKVYCK